MKSKETLVDKILRVLILRKLNYKQISNQLGVNRQKVSATLNHMRERKLVFVVDEIRQDGKTYQIWARKKPYPRQAIPREQPFSDNEMHYGREGRKYKIEDVIKEL